ncbi:MAG: copper amine oxidase N-terminal domain-containing protein [Armatimonadota bacterium]
MDRNHIRRVVSLVVAMTMTLSVVASAVEAAVATWLAPQPGQKLTTRNVEVAIGYNTHSDVKVTRLELWVDGKLSTRKTLVRPEARGVCSFWWDTARYSDGPHDLVVKVYAGDELLSKVSSTGTVGDYKYDLRPPTVSFANIKSGDVLKGLTTLKLSAQDDSGEPPLVSLLVDKKLKLVQNRPPYNYDLDTTSYSDGSHELQTYAYDGVGNKSDPAVVQVAFKNGLEKPVVTTLNVAPHSNPEKFDEAPPVEALPAVAASSASPATRGSAGRVVSSSSSAVAPSAPVASVPKHPAAMSAAPTARIANNAKPVVASKSHSAAKPVLMAKAEPVIKISPALEPVKVSVPAVSANPSNVFNLPSAGVREDAIKPVTGGISVRPVEPEQGRAALVSPARPVTVSQSPLQKILAPNESLAAAGSPVEPSQLTEAQASRDTRMAMAGAAALRSDDVKSAFSGGARAIEEMMPVPVIDSPTAANPKPVRMAAVPYVKDVNAERASNRAYGCPPPVKKDTRAKIEKRTAPASGKVKLRDLYNDLSGVLFWDPDTRTVTGISNNMKIVLTIGSNLALVNGKKMQISEAPRIVDGRTVIDVSIYHQASAFLSSGTRTSSAAK